MRLLKLIGFFFAIYFIRRFIQMYKAMSAIQEQNQHLRQQQQTQSNHQPKNADIIEADFKVVDR